MAKGSVKVTKAKAPAQAKEQSAEPMPEPVGRLFEPLASARRDIDRFFEGLMPGFARTIDFDPFRQFGTAIEDGRSDLMPHVELSEEKKSYEITAELPGVSEQDVSVTLKDHMLIISGEKKSEREEKEQDHVLSERRYGSFRRSFRLPDDVDEDKITASFDKGVMAISLPKVSTAKPKGRRIPVA